MGLLFNIIPPQISQLIIAPVILTPSCLLAQEGALQMIKKGSHITSKMKFENINAGIVDSPFAGLLSFEPVEAAAGRVKLRLPFSEKLLQSLGRLHGGALFSLA